MAKGRPDALVQGLEQDWYQPSEFRQASIDPTARGENASIFGSESVINPMSWGNMLSEKQEQPQIDPSDILAYEKDLQQNETTDKYYGLIDRATNMAVTARKSGFDINRPDPLDPNQRLLTQEYQRTKREAQRLMELAKQGGAVQANLPKTTKDKFMEAVTPENLQGQYGYYNAGNVAQVRKNAIEPEIEAFNKNVEDTYLNTDIISQIIDQQKTLKDKYVTLANSAPNENMRLYYQKQADAVDAIGRKVDYNPQELDVKRQESARKAAGDGDKQNTITAVPEYSKRFTTSLSGQKFPVSGMGTAFDFKGKKILTKMSPFKFINASTGIETTTDETIVEPSGTVLGMTPIVPSERLIINPDWKETDGKKNKYKRTTTVPKYSRKPFKSGEELLTWLINEPIEKLAQYEPTVFVTGTIYDDANITESVDATTGESIYTFGGGDKKTKGTNRTFSYPIMDWNNRLLDPNIARMSARSNGQVEAHYNDPNSLENKGIRIYNERMQNEWKGKSAGNKSTAQPSSTQSTKQNTTVPSFFK